MLFWYIGLVGVALAEIQRGRATSKAEHETEAKEEAGIGGGRHWQSFRQRHAGKSRD